MSEKPITTLAGLVEAGLVAPGEATELGPVAERYAMALTPGMARLIDPGRPDDPIGLQFIPDMSELAHRAEELADPIGDHARSPVEGIVHRYPDRVLLKAVHVCPVYCRFCFRREMVGPQGDGMLSSAALDRAMDYIAANPDIWEVILTGGDPLVLSARRLADLMERLAVIPHVRIVRFHSRVPLVDPLRINTELVDALRASDKIVYVALHANHASEFTEEGKAAVARIVDAGIAMVSQTVLLKGINDDVDTLARLMRVFVENRVKPYYLHHPDLAPGTARFRVPIAEGQRLAAALRGRISGLCQPTYVLDLPGGYGKVPVARPAIREIGDGCYGVTDHNGSRHRYCDSAAN